MLPFFVTAPLEHGPKFIPCGSLKIFGTGL
jgi:hypothetical protein